MIDYCYRYLVINGSYIINVLRIFAKAQNTHVTNVKETTLTLNHINVKTSLLDFLTYTVRVQSSRHRMGMRFYTDIGIFRIVSFNI